MSKRKRSRLEKLQQKLLERPLPDVDLGAVECIGKRVVDALEKHAAEHGQGSREVFVALAVVGSLFARVEGITPGEALDLTLVAARVAAGADDVLVRAMKQAAEPPPPPPPTGVMN